MRDQRAAVAEEPLADDLALAEALDLLDLDGVLGVGRRPGVVVPRLLDGRSVGHQDTRIRGSRPGVDEVGDQVEQDREPAGDEEERHHGVRIDAVRARLEQLPHAGPAEDRSVITAPPMMPPMSNATIVAIGMSALRNAWRTTTVRSVRPLARAVRM